MAQTAVEWLVHQLKSRFDIDIERLSVTDQAKAIEKENIEDCWIAAKQSEDSQTFFNYYNETYNK